VRQGLVWLCTALQRELLQSAVRTGGAVRGTAREGLAMRGLALSGLAWEGWAMHGVARHGSVLRRVTRCMARLRRVGLSEDRRRTAARCLAGHCKVRFFFFWRNFENRAWGQTGVVT
jgi:hypothetical protein